MKDKFNKFQQQFLSMFYVHIFYSVFYSISIPILK